MIRAVLFDMDGVLVDSEDISIRIGIEYFASKGLALVKEDFSGHLGTGEKDFFGGPASDKGFSAWSQDEASSFFRSRYPVLTRDRGMALPGAVDTVRACAAAGILTAVCSSAPLWKVEANISSLGLDVRDFDLVASFADIRRNKPYPDIYRLALARLGVDPWDAVVFEDSPGGIAAGRAAGCRTVGLETTVDGDAMAAAGAGAVIGDLSVIGSFSDPAGLEERLFPSLRSEVVYGANVVSCDGVPAGDLLVGKALEKAAEARLNAYAPYSGFKVGAAVISAATKRIYAGCNVENSSYGATICAERNAILSAVAEEGVFGIDVLAVVSDDNPPAPPCALCLQVAAEFANPGTRVVLGDLKGNKTVHLFKDLLPKPFIFPTMRK